MSTGRFYTLVERRNWLTARAEAKASVGWENEYDLRERDALDWILKAAYLVQLRKAWSQETSAMPLSWSRTNPSCGQCAVTALVVQDIYGGDLLRTTVGGTPHYLNLVEDGTRLIDVTLVQFYEHDEIDATPEVREREYVLSFPDTVARYELLKKRMSA